MTPSLLSLTRRTVAAATLLVAASLPSHAQSAAPEWQWVKRTPDKSTSFISNSATDAGGNTCIIGGFLGNATFGNTVFTSDGSSSSTNDDSYVAKHDAQGAILWARQITGYGRENLYDLASDAAGNIYVVGMMTSPTTFVSSGITLSGASSDKPNLYVAKYNSAGTLLWARNFSGTRAGVDKLDARAIAASPTGVIYVAADLKGSASFDATTLETPTGTTPVLLQLSSDGVVQWAKAASVETATQISLPGVATSLGVDATGAVYLAGTLSGSLRFGSNTVTCSPLRNALFLVRYDATGNVLWASQSAGTGNEDVIARRLVTDAEGNTYVTGYFGEGRAGSLNGTFGPYTLTSRGLDDVFLVKYDVTGTPRWARSFGDTKYDNSNTVTFAPNGDILIGGSFTNTITLAPGLALTSRGDNDIFLARYNDQGVAQWAQQAGGPSGGETINSLSMDGAGNIYAYGQANPNSVFGSITQVSPFGPFSFASRLSSTVLSTHTSHAAQALALYPSPASGASDVQLGSLPKGTVLHLSDALGRVVCQQTVGLEPAHLTLPGVRAGLYALKATVPNGEYYTGRLVVE